MKYYLILNGEVSVYIRKNLNDIWGKQPTHKSSDDLVEDDDKNSYQSNVLSQLGSAVNLKSMTSLNRIPVSDRKSYKSTGVSRRTLQPFSNV